MSATFQAVQWNPQKRRYDAVLAGSILLFLVAFAVLTKTLHPTVTDEILVLRATAAAAFALLHVILCVGPLARLNPRFLPLLYNRRHAGVAMALLALAHGILVLVTYHAGGNVPPLISLLASERPSGAAGSVPFQLAGAGALAILVTMAATSHDFWLAHLSPGTWKRLHMLVYPAYGLLILHVAFGALQAEPHPLYLTATGAGLVLVLSLHVAAAIRERRVDLAPEPKPQPPEGMVPIGPVAGIPLNRARIIRLNGERVAIFRHARGLSAVSNVCQHQNGPLGEGRIIDGCITCPWHGYQYLPESGASPPPFTEKVATFRVAVVEGQIWIDPNPNPPGTPVPPAPIPESCTSQP